MEHLDLTTSNAWRNAEAALPAAQGQAAPARPSAGFRRIDRPGYETVARRYLRVLGGIRSGAMVETMIDGRSRRFLADLEQRLRAAVDECDLAGDSSANRLEAQSRLEWLCNLCEHWLGPAAMADGHVVAAASHNGFAGQVGVTDGEHAAIALLWRLVAILGRWSGWRLPACRVGVAGLLVCRLREVVGCVLGRTMRLVGCVLARTMRKVPSPFGRGLG